MLGFARHLANQFPSVVSFWVMPVKIPVACQWRRKSLMKKLYLILCFFAVFIFALYGGDAQLFICRKCNDTTVKEKQPTIHFCGSGGNHLWFSLGQIGEQIYVCRKCRLLVATAARPKINFCTASGNHDWFFLGKTGKDHYRCKKCQLEGCFSNRPAINFCFAGGNHDWFKY